MPTSGPPTRRCSWRDADVDVCVQLSGGLWNHAAIAGIVRAAGGATAALDVPGRRIAAGAVAFANAALLAALTAGGG